MSEQELLDLLHFCEVVQAGTENGSIIDVQVDMFAFVQLLEALAQEQGVSMDDVIAAGKKADGTYDADAILRMLHMDESQELVEEDDPTVYWED